MTQAEKLRGFVEQATMLLLRVSDAQTRQTIDRGALEELAAKVQPAARGQHSTRAWGSEGERVRLWPQAEKVVTCCCRRPSLIPRGDQ
eukprot:361616-Chlamydomonas_euryale.AAC.8